LDEGGKRGAGLELVEGQQRKKRGREADSMNEDTGIEVLPFPVHFATVTDGSQEAEENKEK